jgi:hypothetical protein
MHAEPSPWQRPKTGIRNACAANLALAVPPGFHSLKCHIDFLHEASLPVEICQDKVPRQIAVGFGALIIRLVLQKSLGSLLRKTRKQSIPLGR